MEVWDQTAAPAHQCQSALYPVGLLEEDRRPVPLLLALLLALLLLVPPFALLFPRALDRAPAGADPHSMPSRWRILPLVHGRIRSRDVFEERKRSEGNREVMMPTMQVTWTTRSPMN